MISTQELQSNGSGTGSKPRLRIMIVSTPKTGNTWMKHLLSATYDLPVVDLPVTFKAEEAKRLGERWIGQQHYYPNPSLLRWAEQNGVIFVTTVRHPGDTFLSLYHYTLNFGEQPRHDKFLLEAAQKDGHELGANIVHFIRNRFFCYLNISIAWLHSGQSYVVRYEELWRDPVDTLAALTSRILPVDPERITSAVRRSDIRALRKKQGHDPRFFRQGSVGEWRQAIPQEILEIFRSVEPYPTQFAALGYTLDPADPLIDAPPRPRPEPHAILDVTAFDTGIPFTPILVDLYLSVDNRVSRHWPAPGTTTGPNNFFNWINSPSDEDDHLGTELPVITNLARYIHFVQQDIRKLYPDLYGKDRVPYLMWFQREAGAVCQLHEAFIQPVKKAFTRWAVRPSAEDPFPGQTPIVTDLAAELHGSRRDLQTQWPDIYDDDRIEFSRWFIQYPQWEYGFDRECLLPVLLSWANGAKANLGNGDRSHWRRKEAR